MSQKPNPVIKPQAGTVLIVSDTFIDGEHVRAGTVRTVSGTNLSLLREANRCVDFDPENAQHRAALEATKKADKDAVAAAEKAADAAAEKAATEAKAVKAK
jgi:hypothetical protein